MSKLEKVGTIMVDAGIVMVGDPCYSLPDDGSFRTEIARDWGQFCDALYGAKGALNRTPLGPGVSVVVSSGGDGAFPVYVQRDAAGRVTQLIVKFIEED